MASSRWMLPWCRSWPARAPKRYPPAAPSPIRIDPGWHCPGKRRVRGLPRPSQSPSVNYRKPPAGGGPDSGAGSRRWPIVAQVAALTRSRNSAPICIRS